MKIYKYVFISVCFIFLNSPLAFSCIVPKIYLPTFDMQNNICNAAVRVKFSGVDDNGAYGGKGRQNIRSVVDILKKMIKMCPYNYENYSRLAFIYDYDGDYDSELGVLKDMLKYTPDIVKDRDVDYGNLGRVYLMIGNLDKAQYWFKKANKVNPANIINSQNYLICCILKRDFKAAAEELKIIDKLSGKDEDWYFDAWQYCMDKIKDGKQIVKFFRIACNDNPGSFKAHRALGIAIRTSSMGNYERNMPLAIKEFKKAILLNPRYIPTYISIADTYIFLAFIKKEKGPFKKAKEWLDKAYKIDPKNVNLSYIMGRYFLYTKNYDSAIKKLEYVYNKDPKNKDFRDSLASAYNQKAYFLYKSGKDLNYGIKLINKAMEIKPNDGIILSTKAELLYKLGRYREAYKYIKKSIKLIPDEDEIKRDFKMIKDALGRK